MHRWSNYGASLQENQVRQVFAKRCFPNFVCAFAARCSLNVEVWQRNEQEPDNPKVWFYRHYGPGDTIDFASIAVQIKIGEFYRGLEFDEGELEDE
jgi:hypothetical protein